MNGEQGNSHSAVADGVGGGGRFTGNNNGEAVIEVDVLISGAGPAGASLACFLATQGINVMMIAKAPGTSTLPKANYVNMAAFECFQDLGIRKEAERVAYPCSEYSTYHRICKSLAGEEIYRAYAFGNDPHRHGDYAEASPYQPMSLYQSDMEPLLLRCAAGHGVTCRFNTEFLSFTQDDNGVTSAIVDLSTKQKIRVRSKYLCGADGATSQIAQQIQLPICDASSGGLSINIHVEAEMSHLVRSTPGLLHVLTRPDKIQPYFGLVGLARFIKPWSEWVIVLICRPGTTRVTASTEEIMARAQELIGDDSVILKLKDISFWRMNECYAEKYSVGRVHCLGDAVHRHPPQNGLGANTGIQDAANLAWKMAYVLKGLAHPSILSTFNDERQPVGRFIVKRANDTGRLQLALFKALGLLDPDLERRVLVDQQLSEATPEAEERRAAIRKAIKDLDEERHALGAEMNQWYRSDAVYTFDEKKEPDLPVSERDQTLYHTESTYPGFRVPHTWICPPKKGTGPRPELVSTRELCGHGRFTILTGIGGKTAWTRAAAGVTEALRVEVVVYSIGWGQDYEDTFFKWFDKREVTEDGAVLVRPDRTVAWRCQTVPLGERACENKLTTVMRRVLGFGQ